MGEKRVTHDKSNVTSTNCGKKKSIFFELEYWRYLHVRHNLDVMHIEKSAYESIIGIILNIIGKTKDGLNSWLDLMDMGLRCGLALRFESNRTYLMSACYTLSRMENKVFCQTLIELKVPEGIAQTLEILCQWKIWSSMALSLMIIIHWCKQLLLVALQSLFQKHVWHATTKLSLFFNALCKKVVDVSTLDKLQNELVVALCLLEKYFPSSFFDIMIHLTVPLVRGVRLYGLIYFRWMYPFERFMKVLKGYVQNRNHLKGCIVECYIVEKAIEFCTEYLSNMDAIRVLSSTNVDHKVGAPIPRGHITEVDSNLLLQAHHYVLENTTIIQPYIK